MDPERHIVRLLQRAVDDAEILAVMVRGSTVWGVLLPRDLDVSWC